jgi:hypothetical protein
VTTIRNAIVVVLLIAAAVFAHSGPSLKCRVVVPKEYRKTPFNPPPNGEPEPTRYTKAYQAFWWNCVSVRAIDLGGRCPFIANGTPAAAEGAYDGALNAQDQICNLLKKYSAQTVQLYLRAVAGQPEAHERMRSYFQRPTAEK